MVIDCVVSPILQKYKAPGEAVRVRLWLPHNSVPPEEVMFTLLSELIYSRMPKTAKPEDVFQPSNTM